MNKKAFQYYILDKKQKERRIIVDELAFNYASLHLSEEERMVRRFETLMDKEEAFILDGEKIPFVRTVINTPEIYTEDEWDELKKKHYIHESGYKSNLCPDYEKVLNKGLIELAKDGSDAFKRCVEATLKLVDKYKEEANRQNRDDLVSALSQVPAYPARSYYEALICLRIINFALWAEGSYQISLGRFDKYLYPWLEKDLKAGIIDEEEAFELLSEFFLALNKDNDIYPGVQPGDNGQSLMLGGRTKDGDYIFNLISEMSLRASEELKLIDPKINLRVDKNTPDYIFELGSRLTKVGLGFPQYSNDDIVIDGLVKLGYDHDDAVEYVVAACWEFIIPSVAEDVVNIQALSLPKVVDECLHNDLLNSETYEDFKECVSKEIEKEVIENCEKTNNLHFVVCPLLDGLMDYPGGKPKYINYGMHGVGMSTAVDSLTAIEKHIYLDKDISKEKLIEIVDDNFENSSELLHLLRYETEKLGNNGDMSNANLVFVTETFGNCLNNRHNDKGGIWRAGTGSAMYYLWYADEIGATADGRRKGEPFATNYSVSLYAEINPFSLLLSMTKPDLKKVINGGPLTVEFHSSLFVNDEAIKTVGKFVKKFIELGGHQLQLNTVNRDQLLDAQAHPEKHPLLIVRIWGWSAYFVELEKVYQDHVISRQEYVL